MSILAFILFGLVIGLLARAIMPGRQSMGLVATALVGMAGSLIGGLIGNLISGDSIAHLRGAGIIGSILGTLFLLFLMGYAGRHRRALT
ncbi:MAG: GlsB/YeaQ/YmgE family stress response membrane protein [Labilithrix sp.]|nr:GlsB/YeaQ/YmgE family stress response membrane protein [Labilithrix sp.]